MTIHYLSVWTVKRKLIKLSALTPLEELSDHLKTIRIEDWQKLFDLLPDFEQTKKFGEFIGGEKQKDGSFTFPYVDPAEIVFKFHRIVHDLGIITIFDWPGWNEGMMILKEDRKNFDQYDLLTLCKFITAIVRNDRFCDGVLVGYFENGVIPKIIQSIQNKIV